MLQPWLKKIRAAGIPLFTVDTISPYSGSELARGRRGRPAAYITGKTAVDDVARYLGGDHEAERDRSRQATRPVLR